MVDARINQLTLHIQKDLCMHQRYTKRNEVICVQQIIVANVALYDSNQTQAYHLIFLYIS